MTERKKPGPKPKCKECGRKEGEGHYDDCPVGLGVVEANTFATWGAADRRVLEASQAYALRVWEGQSVSLPRHERVERVKRALEGQNLPFEGVELP
jgi:hypothetical protein